MAAKKRTPKIKKSTTSELNISTPKKRIFFLITILIPVFFFFIFEIILQLFNYCGNLNLFISAPGEYDNYFICNPDVGKRYFFVQNSVPDPPNDIFLKDKPQNGYRIFVLGGSSAAGYPYGNNIMFSRILQKRLTDVFPEKNIEVINTAITAVNSFTILDFIDEVIDAEADAVLIYAGHNEFYGALGAASNESLGKIRPLVKLYLKLQRFKTFILVRNIIGSVRRWKDNKYHGGSLNNPNATLMERIVGDQIIPINSSIYDLGKNQFKQNLRSIIKKTKEAKIDIILSDLVSNVRDLKPFVSVKTDSFPPADQIYLLAQNFEQAEKFDQAKEKYYLAKDLDGLRFRATEEFNRIIHQLALEFNVPVVPMESYFENASPGSLIGDNLMLEHLHPNVDGYFLMAAAFFETMKQNNLITTDWTNERIKSSTFYRQNWGFTRLDTVYANLRIRYLKNGWPFKPKSLPNRAIADFKPTSMVDSIALKIMVNKNVNLERGHVELAKYYEKRKQFDSAYLEYRALIYETPFNVSPYLGAADMLIKQKKFDLAFPLLQKTLSIEETPYAFKWIGQIYLNDNEVQKSIPFLQKALKLVPDEPQVLYNISGAYALSGQYQKADSTLSRLEKISPKFPDADHLRKQLDRILTK